MAKSDVVGQLQSSFLSCSICFQSFTKPKALPCLHTFCEGCLRDYIASRYESAGQFPCPICRQVIYIPPSGVYAFPDNHFIISLQDTVSHSDEYSSSGDFTSSLSHSNYNPNIPLINADKFQVSFSKAKKRSSAVLLRTFGHFGMDQDGLVHISGMAYSILTDHILIADCSLNKILIYSSDGSYRGGFMCDCSVRDLAVSSTGSILVTVSRAESAVLREYGFDGRLVASYGSYYKYTNPFGLAITRMGKVIISSLQENNIHILTERKKPSIKFGSRGSGLNHFLLPYYIAVNSRDDVIIADSGNHRVKVHKNDGSIIHSFGKQGSQNGEMFYPMGICVDKNDNIYVADANNFRVQVFSERGEYLATPIEHTYEFGVDVKPTNVMVVNGRLFVALRGTKKSEVHIYQWETPLQSPAKQKSNSILSCCSCLFPDRVTYDEI